MCMFDDDFSKFWACSRAGSVFQSMQVCRKIFLEFSFGYQKYTTIIDLGFCLVDIVMSSKACSRDLLHRVK